MKTHKDLIPTSKPKLIWCAALVSLFGWGYFLVFCWPQIIEYNGPNTAQERHDRLFAPNFLLGLAGCWLLFKAFGRGRSGQLRWYHWPLMLWTVLHGLISIFLLG